ncbi:pheromone A receptor-domain-containing protein [Schizophyllum fasciatum]
MLDPTYPLFPIFAFLGFVLALTPMPWHLQAWNSGTCFFMAWTALGCLNQFVNSIVWKDNAINSAPIWCEISIRITMGLSVGLPASSLCIIRRLYHIAKVRAVSHTRAEKMRIIIIDALICVLFPMVYIAMQYIVQGHRFNILENIGCYPAVFNTGVTYVVSYVWPIIIGIISATYSVLALIEFNRHRLQFSQFLHSSASLSVSRYLRLMALAMTEMCCTVPLGIFVIVLNCTSTRIEPWVSIEATHYWYSRVDQYPAVMWRSSHLVVVCNELTRWLAPVSAFIFFFYFGFADEARRNYAAAWARVRRALGLPECMPTLPTSKKPPTMSSDKGFAEKVKGFSTKAQDFASGVKGFAPNMKGLSSTVKDLTAKAKQYTTPRPTPPTPSSTSSSAFAPFNSTSSSSDASTQFSAPIPIHLSGMRALGSFDAEKALPLPPAYDAEYTVHDVPAAHLSFDGRPAVGLAYSSASEHGRLAPGDGRRSVDAPHAREAPSLPATPSSCSSSATFSTLQSRDFIVLPSSEDVARRGSGSAGADANAGYASAGDLEAANAGSLQVASLPTRGRSPAGPPRLPSLSQLFGIASTRALADDVEAQVAGVQARAGTTADAPASPPRTPERGLPDVPTSPRSHHRSASV